MPEITLDDKFSKLPNGEETDKLMKLIHDHGIKNPKVSITRGSIKGDNYLGAIYKIVATDDDNRKRIDLICKCSTRDGGFRKFVCFPKLFGREIYMYQEVLPIFHALQEKLAIEDKFRSYAKLYAGSSTEMDEYMIMNDMKSIGYVMQDRKQPLDYDHCKLVLANLGQYHALSFALKLHDPEMFEKIRSDTVDIFFDIPDIEIMRKHFESMADKAERALDPVKDTVALEKFQKFRETFFETILSFSNAEVWGEYGVITHGDCWINNMLFKYDETNTRPTDLCFLDWQLSRYASPVIDISYFICNCTSTKLRETNFDDLVQIYYNSLSGFLQQLGYNVEELYPLHVLEDHLSRFFVHGLALACSTLHLFISDAEEVPDMNDIVELDEKELENWTRDSKNIDLYHERIGGVIRDLVKRKYI